MKVKLECLDCESRFIVPSNESNFQCPRCGSRDIELIEDDKKIDRRQERKMVRDIKAFSSKSIGRRKKTLSDFRPIERKERDRSDED